MPSFNPVDVSTLLTSIAAEGGTSEDLVAIANERWIIRRALTSARPIWIDGSVLPKIPDGCTYREEDQSPHLFRGRFDFNKVDIAHSQAQQVEGCCAVMGETILRDLPIILPSHIIDLIEEDPTLFQKDWSHMFVFCGTVFRAPHDCTNRDFLTDRCVRFVRRRYGKVSSGIRYLEDIFGEAGAMTVPRNLNE